MSRQSDAERAACRELRCPHKRCHLHDRPHCPVCPHRVPAPGKPPCAACGATGVPLDDGVCIGCGDAGVSAPTLF